MTTVFRKSKKKGRNKKVKNNRCKMSTTISLLIEKNKDSVLNVMVIAASKPVPNPQDKSCK